MLLKKNLLEVQRYNQAVAFGMFLVTAVTRYNRATAMGMFAQQLWGCSRNSYGDVRAATMDEFPAATMGEFPAATMGEFRAATMGKFRAATEKLLSIKSISQSNI